MTPKPRRPRRLNADLLPPQLRTLMRVLGEADALRLVEQRGGTFILVPVRVSREHWLNDVLAPAAFAALVSEYRGIQLELPKYDSVLRQWRHQQVLSLVVKRLTDSEVALRTGYSRRHVISIRQAEAVAAGEAPEDGLWPVQGDLFPDLAEAGATDAEEAETLPTAHNPFGLGVRNPRQDV